MTRKRKIVPFVRLTPEEREEVAEIMAKIEALKDRLRRIHETAEYADSFIWKIRRRTGPKLLLDPP